MQVIYKKTILDEIDQVITNAFHFGKEIEKIILTQKEWVDLHQHCLSLNVSTKYNYYRGVQITYEDYK